MPAVSVLPLRSTVGSSHLSTDTRLLEVIVDGMPEVHPVSHIPDSRENSAKKATGDVGEHKAKGSDAQGVGKPSDVERKGSNATGGTVSPSQSTNSYPHGLPPHLTPQQPGYYVAYQSQITPEPPSPAGPGTIVYDVGSFLQQPTGFSPFTAAQYAVGPIPGQRQAGQAPPSPSQNSIPPASPLFPRIAATATGLLDPNRILEVPAGQQRGAPLSPGPPYLSPALGHGGAMYTTMNAYGVPMQGVVSTGENGSSEDYAGWGDGRNQVSPYPQNSPQISGQGIPIPYVPGMPARSASASARSYSFEETMLTPSVESQQDQYTIGHISPGSATPGTLFAHQAWAYAGPPPDMYGASASPLQPRPTMAYGTMHVGPPRHHGPPTMGAYGGQFYPATSPGPPIQTTASNKGPDGANLFIFHIPNHFTNLDMYQLFCPYGNLLSVRIMVEKDTGRSRGFGFVSYDSPESAALAIKELNGFAIGNKRLKVQHKQIRPGDQNMERGMNPGYEMHRGNTAGPFDQGMMSSMPPSGHMAGSGDGWYGEQDGDMAGEYEATPDQQPYDGAAVPVVSEDSSSGADPLSGLEPLRQALPETGHVSNSSGGDDDDNNNNNENNN